MNVYIVNQLRKSFKKQPGQIMAMEGKIEPISDLKKGMKVNEKIKCEQCDKMLPGKYLKAHNKRAHLKVKDRECEVCEKSFYNTTELNTHRIVHEERKFSCNTCGLKIRSKQSLVNHMESRHMGISKKPYFCKDCGAHFSYSGHKRTHMDQSKLEKFPCDTCGKQFGLNKNLKKHEKRHNVERSGLIYSNNFKLDVLKKSEKIGIDKTAKLVGIKDSTIKGWGDEDEGRCSLVIHHTLQIKKDVVAFALDTSVAEAEKKYNIEGSTIRSWMKKLKKCGTVEDLDFAPRKDYVQRKYSAQVSNYIVFFSFSYPFLISLFVVLNLKTRFTNSPAAQVKQQVIKAALTSSRKEVQERFNVPGPTVRQDL